MQPTRTGLVAIDLDHDGLRWCFPWSDRPEQDAVAFEDVVSSAQWPEVGGIGGSVRPRVTVVDVAELRGDHTSRCLTHAVTEGECDVEDIGAEPANVFMGEHVAGDWFKDHSVPEGVAGACHLGDPAGGDCPLSVGGLGETVNRAGEDVGVDHDGDVGVDDGVGGFGVGAPGRDQVGFTLRWWCGCRRRRVGLRAARGCMRCVRWQLADGAAGWQ